MLLPIPFSSADSCQQALQCVFRRGLNGGRGNQARGVTSRVRREKGRAEPSGETEGEAPGVPSARREGLGEVPAGHRGRAGVSDGVGCHRFRRRGGRRTRETSGKGWAAGALRLSVGPASGSAGGNPENVACRGRVRPQAEKLPGGAAPPANRPEVLRAGRNRCRSF